MTGLETFLVTDILRTQFFSMIPAICSGKAVIFSTKQCRKQVTIAKVFLGLSWTDKFTKLLPIWK